MPGYRGVSARIQGEWGPLGSDYNYFGPPHEGSQNPTDSQSPWNNFQLKSKASRIIALILKANS